MTWRKVAVPHFRLRIVLLFFTLMGVTVILGLLSLSMSYTQKGDMRLCFMDKPHSQLQIDEMMHETGSVPLEDVLLAEHKPTPGRSIFFHETSCHHPSLSGLSKIFGNRPTLNLWQLTARQACAIESAALNNPNSDVFVMFARPTYRTNTTTDPLLEAVLSYSNVYLRTLNLWTYAANTPIYTWLKDGALFTSRYVLSHTSDFLRYLTLWRWGGTYLDMDVVVLRTIEDLPPNYTGAESSTALAAGVMNFAHDGFGHEVAMQCLRDFQRNFDGQDWGTNGPGVITRVMQSVCGTKNVELMVNNKRCMGFTIFGSKAFYAIPWRKWEDFFETKSLQKTLSLVKDSYVAHVWNKHSKQRRVKVGSNVAYAKLAEKHCPKVYAAAGEYF